MARKRESQANDESLARKNPKELTKKKEIEELLPIEPSLTYRLFYPQVPMIVCAKHGEDVAGMTANSVMSVSDSPPKVSLAISAKSRTSRIIRDSRRFSINWLSYHDASSRKAVIDLSKPFKENKDITTTS